MASRVKIADQLKWIHSKAHIVLLCEMVLPDSENATISGAGTIDIQRCQFMLGSGNALLDCLDGVTLVESPHTSLIVRRGSGQPNLADDSNNDNSNNNTNNSTNQTNNTNNNNNNHTNNSNYSQASVELCCGNVGILPALLAHQLNKLRDMQSGPHDIPPFSSQWAKDHVIIASPFTSSHNFRKGGYIGGALSTLAIELKTRKVTHVLPTTIATAKFFLENPGIFDSLPSCGAVYPSRYIIAVASQTHVLGEALNRIWQAMSTTNDPLDVSHLSHVAHRSNQKRVGGKRKKSAPQPQEPSPWNSAILHDEGSAACSWIKEGMTIYALSLEAAAFQNFGNVQGCPAYLYELAVGESKRLECTDRGQPTFRAFAQTDGNTTPPAEMDSGSWLVFHIPDKYEVTGVTYTIDCQRTARHSGDYPVLRVERSDGNVMSDSLWSKVGTKKQIASTNKHAGADKLKSDFTTSITNFTPPSCGIYRITFLEVHTGERNRYLPISFTPWPLCTLDREYTPENIAQPDGTINRLTEAMASALRMGVTAEHMAIMQKA